MEQRKAVGGVYLTFLLPVMMGRSTYVATLGIYLFIAITGAYPEIAGHLSIKPIQAEAILLILLVLVGHRLVWDFMVRA